MNIKIIGGGIAGLSAAIALSNRDFEVTVFEQSFEYRNAGLGFMLLPNGLEALDRIGLGDRARSLGKRIQSITMRRSDGSLMKNEELLDSICVRRHDFLRLLRRQLPASAVRSGMKFIRFETGAGGRAAAACFEDRCHDGARHREEGDLFVGADGVRSGTRRHLYPGYETSPVLVKELVSMVPASDIAAELDDTFLKVHHRDGGLAVGLVPARPGDVIWFLQYDCHRWDVESSDSESRREFARRLLADWPSPIPSLIERTDFSASHVWNTTDMDLLPSFFRGNVVLIGDAAHTFLPFTSQGVNSALQDAAELADALAACRGAAIQCGLPEFDRERRDALGEYIHSGRLLRQRFLDPGAVIGEVEVPLIN